MTEEGIALFEQLIGGLEGKGLNPQGISMKFASVAQVGSQKPDGRAVMESSYEEPDTQIALKGGVILHVVFKEGKFRFVKVCLSGKANVPNTGSKSLSLSVHNMENCLMAGKITVGGDTFVFKDQQKAQKQIRCLFPK